MNKILTEIAHQLYNIEWDDYTPAEKSIIEILEREGIIKRYKDNGREYFEFN